jgi:surface antigen
VRAKAMITHGHNDVRGSGKSPGRLALYCVAPLLLVIAPLGGCSVSMPIGSIFSAEEDPATGTVQQPADTGTIRVKGRPALTAAMDGEDTRRSQSAIALALDPEGNSLPVGWDNPQSGNKGEFRSTGAFYLDGNQLCRRFAATFEKDSTVTAYDGSACRVGPQSWLIIDAQERSEAAEPVVLDQR